MLICIFYLQIMTWTANTKTKNSTTSCPKALILCHSGTEAKRTSSTPHLLEWIGLQWKLLEPLMTLFVAF